jgi:hypothetical protein
MHEVSGVIAVSETQGMAEFMTGNISGSGTAEGFAKCLTAELDGGDLQLTGEWRSRPWATNDRTLCTIG